MPEREVIRTAIAKTLVNAGNYPHAVAPYVLGRDMSLLVAAVTTAVMNALETTHPDPTPLTVYIERGTRLMAEAYNDGFEAGVRAGRQQDSEPQG